MAESKYPYTPKSVSLTSPELQKKAQTNPAQEMATQAAPHLVASNLSKLGPIVKGKSKEEIADAKDVAATHLTNIQELAANTPEEDRPALLAQQHKLLEERAAAENRDYSTGEKIAMAILGAAPLIAAASTQGSDWNAANAASAGIQGGFRNQRRDEIARAQEQKDKELGINEKNIDRLNRKDEKLADYEQQDKLDRSKSNREFAKATALQDRQNKIDIDKEDKATEEAFKTGLSYMVGARLNPALRPIRQSVQKADSALATLNSAAKEFTHNKKGLTQLSDTELDGMLNSLTKGQRIELAGALDSMIKGGVGTVSGTEHLTADELQSWLKDRAQWLSGNENLSGNAAGLLKKQLNSFYAERDVGIKKLIQEQGVADEIVAPRITTPERAARWERMKRKALPPSIQDLFSVQDEEANTPVINHEAIGLPSSKDARQKMYDDMVKSKKAK